MSNNMILDVGSINMDQVVQVPRLPVLGETLLGAGSLKLVPGENTRSFGIHAP